MCFCRFIGILFGVFSATLCNLWVHRKKDLSIVQTRQNSFPETVHHHMDRIKISGRKKVYRKTINKHRCNCTRPLVLRLESIIYYVEDNNCNLYSIF